MSAIALAPVLVRRPKQHGGSRVFTLLPPTVLAHYGRAVDAVAPAIEAAAGPEAIADRSSRGSDGTVRALRARITRLSETAGAVAVTDVEDFFPSISPQVVERALRWTGADRGARLVVRQMLESFSEQGVPGLPVGPRPSAVLAQAVMLPMDSALRSRHTPMARWVDDIAFAAPSEERAERMLERIAEALAAMGLRENLGKRRIMDPAEFARGWVRAVSYHRS